MSWLQVSSRGVIVTVHAVPRAARTAVQGLHGDAVKIRLQAPPVEGKANAALIRFLSLTLDIPARQIMMLSGLTGRHKRVLISGVDATTVCTRLGLSTDSSTPAACRNDQPAVGPSITHGVSHRRRSRATQHGQH